MRMREKTGQRARSPSNAGSIEGHAQQDSGVEECRLCVKGALINQYSKREH